jgi:hypothetical protein
MISRVRRDGQIRESELDLPATDGGTARTLTARVAPLGARLVLALVEDDRAGAQDGEHRGDTRLHGGFLDLGQRVPLAVADVPREHRATRAVSVRVNPPSTAGRSMSLSRICPSRRT